MLIEDILGAGKRLVVVAHVLASWCVRPYAASVCGLVVVAHVLASWCLYVSMLTYAGACSSTSAAVLAYADVC